MAALGGCAGPAGSPTAPSQQPAATVAPAPDKPAKSPPPKADPPPPAGLSPAGAFQPQHIIVVQVSFDILRARVPRGAFSESGKIWNHLDEEAIPAETAALLQRNGLRAARGKFDSWPPIKALLDQEKHVEISRTTMTMANGLPLVIQVDPTRRRDQTLFVFRPDGTLGGITCPQSASMLRIEYSIPLTDPNALVATLMPEIRQQQTPGPLAINAAGQLEQRIEEPTRVLWELACRLEVPAESFIALGPSAAARQGYLIGSLLLCEQIDGKPYESMYFITPRVQRSDRSRPP